MNPTCDVPGCAEDAWGRLSLFAEAYAGSLFVALCPVHFAQMLNGIPIVLQGMKEAAG